MPEQSDYMRKVKALLERADNATTDDEARLCRQRAFELMAKHGIDEAMARGLGDNDPIEDMIFRTDGEGVYPYRDLVCYVAEALHCQAAYRVYRSGKLHVRITVYGRRSHLARLQLLIPHLHLQQMREAGRAKPDVIYPEWWAPQKKAAYVRRYRKSFALGWAGTVATRLEAQETIAGREHSPGAALVLMSDLEKAKAAMNAQMKVKEERNGQRVDPDALRRGGHAGLHADLGNAGVAGGRAALA